MSTNGGLPEEGSEPQEEAGPEGCDAGPEQSEIGVEEAASAPEECDFAPKEELVDAMPVEPIPVIRDPHDGLPRPVDVAEAYAPPFTHEHVVCIEDRRQYVEMFLEELVGTGVFTQLAVRKEDLSPTGMVRGVQLRDRRDGYGLVHDGQCYKVGSDLPEVLFYARQRYHDDGQERERETHPPDVLLTLWGQPCVKIGQDSFRPIRPIRPVCKYYRRQCFNNDEIPDPTDPGGRIYFTHCLRRRSVGGAFMSLRDQGVYACDHRDPPDERTRSIHLDGFDERRLQERAHETMIPLFGLPGEDVPADS